jgi:translocation and assembly module TamB
MTSRSVIRAGLALIVGMPLLVCALLFAMLYTEMGSRWVFEQSLKTSAGMVTAGEFRGRLWDTFELGSVHIDGGTAVASIERIKVQWRPRSLLDGELTVAMTELDGIELTVSEATSESDKATPTSLPAPPLPLRLEQLILTRLVIHAAGRDIVVDRLQLGAIWNAAKFGLTDFEVEAYGHHLGAAGAVGVGDDANVAAKADWDGEISGERGKASLAISGPLNDLDFQTSIDAAISAEVTGRVRPFAKTPSFSLSGALQTPNLGEDFTLAESHFDVEGAFPSFKFSLSSEASSPQTGRYGLSLNTEMTISGDTNEVITADVEWRAVPRSDVGEDIVGSGVFRFDGDTIRIEHATQAPFQTRIAGDVVLSSDKPLVNLKFSWNDIQHALNNGSVITSRSGTIDLDGSLKDLGVVIASELDIPPVGPVVINSVGRLLEQRFSVDDLTAKLLNGQLSTQGTVQWLNAVSGDFRFTGRDIDLSTIREDTASRLAFSGDGSFSTDENGIRSNIDLATMSGYLRGQAVTGTAKIATQPNVIKVERARFAAGENRIELSGSLAQQLDGQFNLQLDDLSVFDSRLAGNITGVGAFSGDLKLPRINAELKGSALRLDQHTADVLDINIDVDAARSAESTAEMRINSLSLKGKPLGELVVSGRGNAGRHTARLDFNGEELTVKTQVNGSWQDKEWRGSLETITVNFASAGIWSLVEASGLVYSAGIASLSDTCFESKPARACISGELHGTESAARLELNALPLSLAGRFLPTTLKLDGVVNGAANLKAVNGLVTGSGQLKVSDGSIAQERGAGDLDTVPINAFALDFNLSPDKMSAEAKADVGQWFTLQGQLDAARVSGGSITGAIEAQSADISWIKEFVPELGGSSGELTLTSAIRGTFDAPTGEIHARLRNGAVSVPDVGLEINRVEVNASGDPHSITIDAQLGALEGSLTLAGTAFFEDKKKWRYDLALDGSNFPVVRMPEAEADISPALRIEGDLEALDVTGSLLVPRVFIDVKRLPKSAVNVSEDQIIVDADGNVPVISTNKNFLTDKVSGAVKIRLGDDISINGFGLSSRLSGGVDWKKKRGVNLGSAIGNVIIETGLFKAYGQNMEIEQGRIEFAGPVDNPNLNLRAVRPGLSVKAGVNVTGTVRAPKISLFSEPPLSDGNTLSYIITGRALDDAGAGDAALLTQAALSLGAEESAMVTNQIRDTFGLDEFSIAAGDTTRDTSLVAGKRLSPKLSVRTGFNPFDQLWSFFLNYKLTERWSVEAESGQRQGADLLYSIEREKLIDALMPFD